MECRTAIFFMTPEEHANALKAGGFASAAVLLKQSGLILFQAAESLAARPRRGDQS